MASPFSQSYARLAIRWRSVGILFVCWLLTQFAGIFSPPLLDDADSVHVEAVREMVLRHDYVTLYADGIRYFDKPPLPYWMGAAFAHVLGLHDWAVRLPLALSVLLLTLWIYWLAARLMYRGDNPELGDRAGLFAGLAFATCVGPYLFTRFFIPDVIVALWLTICADLVLRMINSVDKHGRAKWWQSAAFGLVCAACTLTKGLIGVVFPLAMLAGYLVVTAQVRKLWRMRAGLGTGVFLLAAVPWHWLAAVRNPASSAVQRGWFWFYFINDQLNRYLNKRIPRDYDKVPFLLFWGLLLVWLFPWGVFLPAVARRGWELWRARAKATADSSGRRGDLRSDSQESLAAPQTGGALRNDNRKSSLASRLTAWRVALRSPQTLFVVWTLVILVFFSFSTRQEYYTIPAVPPLCLLVGMFLAREPEGARWTRRAGMWSSTALAVVGVAVSAVCFYFAAVSRAPAPGTDLFTELQRHPQDYALSFGHFFDLTAESLGFFRLPLVLFGAGLGLGTLTAFLLRARRRYFLSNLTLAAAMLLVLSSAHRGLDVFYPILGSEPLAAVVNQNWQPDAQIVLDGEYSLASSLNFYTGHPLYMLNGRIDNLWYGSLFPDAPNRFYDDASFAPLWGGPRRIFVVTMKPERVAQLTAGGGRQLAFSGGKYLLVNH